MTVVDYFSLLKNTMFISCGSHIRLGKLQDIVHYYNRNYM